MIKTILVDDEDLSLFTLEKKLQEFPNIHIIKTYNSQEHILSDLRTTHVDVAFLDIEMADLNGLDLAEAILSIQPSIQIVFVTAHSEYAIQAFELNSIDYLLKPITTKRLLKTINRLTKIVEVSRNHEDRTDVISTSVPYIKCFNELQVFRNGQLIHFKTAKVKELFGFFLTNINTYINRDILIESLWPGQDYKKSKIHLHTCLSYLRKTLDELGYSNCITFSDQSYFFTLEPIYCDAIELKKYLQSLDKLDVTNIQIAENTVKLYTGEYMELNRYDWAFVEAQAYQNQMLIFLDKIIDYYQLNDDSKTLFYLQTYLRLNPYSNEKVKQKINLLIKLENRFEAIKTYHEYEQLLLKDLEIELDDSFVELFNVLISTAERS
ncbi:Two-component response regulator, SAPR family, consists of REC, wHTH and BTAD domains [Paenisporosarcina quisquiliarum]|nr:Two-component response regulator, SAPR family, consists of REC, wHTH and BTAD domains [Paenisporosarcina quisquiliarum]